MTKKELELLNLAEAIESKLVDRLIAIQGNIDHPQVADTFARNRGYIAAMQDLQLYLYGDKTAMKIML